MSEETKKAIEELVKATENNGQAKAFLDGFKHGLKVSAGADTSEQDDGGMDAE